MLKKILLVSAISAGFAANPAFAEQQQQQGGGQLGASNQARLQEQTSGQSNGAQGPLSGQSMSGGQGRTAKRWTDR